jgi:hypothetical protein
MTQPPPETVPLPPDPELLPVLPDPELLPLLPDPEPLPVWPDPELVPEAPDRELPPPLLEIGVVEDTVRDDGGVVPGAGAVGAAGVGAVAPPEPALGLAPVGPWLLEELDIGVFAAVADGDFEWVRAGTEADRARRSGLRRGARDGVRGTLVAGAPATIAGVTGAEAAAGDAGTGRACDVCPSLRIAATPAAPHSVRIVAARRCGPVTRPSRDRPSRRFPGHANC